MVYYIKSTDGGNTWSEKKPLYPGIHRAGIDAEDNYIHVVYYSEREGDHNVYYTRSTDFGSSWSVEMRLDDAPPRHSSALISIKACKNKVAVVWEDSRVDGIYYKVSMDNGTSWSEDIGLFTSAEGSCMPEIALDRDHSYVIWTSINHTHMWSYINFKRTVPYQGYLVENVSKPVVLVLSPKSKEVVDGIVEIRGSAFSTNNTTVKKWK